MLRFGVLVFSNECSEMGFTVRCNTSFCVGCAENMRLEDIQYFFENSVMDVGNCNSVFGDLGC